MWNVRYYLPLIGFVVPTLVIGYGFVIPCSCIAGVNELSVGFGSTVLGAALTYFAGIRTATRGACPIRPPMGVRLARYLNRQASHPWGPFGRLLGVIWTFEHRREYRATLELLKVAATDRVLEVGSGPGWGLGEAAQRAVSGHVIGLDVSSAMVAAAQRRNRRLVRAGRVEVRQVSEDTLALPPASLDGVFSVHCLYFWKDPARMLARIAVALRPGGRLVLTFRAASPDLPARFRDSTYRFYSPGEVEGQLRAAGFEDTRVVALGSERGPLFAVVTSIQPLRSSSAPASGSM